MARRLSRVRRFRSALRGVEELADQRNRLGIRLEHARSLELTHPTTSRRLHLTAPLPEHMIRTWDLFGWRPEDAPDDPFEDRR